MKVAIIVDSTSGLMSPLADHPDIYMVDLLINFPDGTTMVDAVDPQTNQRFYDKLKASDTLPTTSQPPVGAYIKVMDEIVAKGYEAVIGIFISGQISGTYSAAKMVMEDYQDRIATYAYNSKAASLKVESMVEQTLDWLGSGLSPEAIMPRLEWLVDHTLVHFMIQDLYFLTKGGRLSTTSAFVGSMLKIKPIIEFDSLGNLILKEKIRSTKKVFAEFVKKAQEEIAANPQGYRIHIVHTNAPELAESLKETFENALGPVTEFRISLLSPVLGTHCGPGLVGFSVLPLYREE